MSAFEAITMFFYLMTGIGTFFTGIGVLWFVTVYKKEKNSLHR
jgi:hypothetical protein